MRRCYLALLALLAGACSSDAPGRSSTVPDRHGPSTDGVIVRDAAVASCADRVAALERWFTGMSPDDLPAIRLSPGMSLVALSANDWPRSRRAEGRLMVEVTPDAVVLRGRALWQRGAPVAPLARTLGDEIILQRKAARRDHAATAATLLIAKDTTWELVAAVAAGVYKGGLAAEFALSGPRRLPPSPPDAARMSELGRMSGTEVNRAMRKLFSPCEPAVRLFGVYTTPATQWSEMTTGLTAALQQCECATSPEDAQAWFWHAAVEPARPAVRVVRARLGDGGSATQIDGKANDTWERIAPKVMDAVGGASQNAIHLNVR